MRKYAIMPVRGGGYLEYTAVRAKGNLRLRLTFSALLIALAAVGAYLMLTNSEGEALTHRGLRSLIFFTVDSNLLMGLISVSDMAFCGAVLRGKRRMIPVWQERLYYMAVVSVSLTFGTVMLFLGPLLGYGAMFAGANLFFHLICPVLAILLFCGLHRGRYMPLWETLFALIPMALYGIYYTALLLIYGIHYPETDWYGFAAGGMRTAPFVAALITGATWGMAWLLRLAAGGRKRK